MRLTVFTALSLVFHLLLVLLLWSVKLVVLPPVPQTVEVVYRKTSEKIDPNAKIFIKNLEIPENMEFEDPNKTDFASEKRHRVLLETRARDTGITKNRTPGPRFMRDFQDAKPKEENKEVSREGFKIFNPKQEIQSFSTGESTISVKLPDRIAVGSFTALNTDRHLYYSFYSRLEDMIYLRWSELIKKAVDSYSTDFKRRRLEGRSIKTDLVVLLKPNGEFYRAEIHSASGVEKLDVSPALAFQDARIFPNPPPEMVRDDGFIHISYSFVVDFGAVQ